jgi:hypothetical protein
MPTEWQCELCPVGADCHISSTIYTLNPRPNYWRVPWAPLEKQYFEKCPFDGDCIITNGTDSCSNGTTCSIANGTDRCVKGTTGPLCALCETGLFCDTAVSKKGSNSSSVDERTTGHSGGSGCQAVGDRCMGATGIAGECQQGEDRYYRRGSKCEVCADQDFAARAAVVFTLILLLLILVYTQRKRIRRIHRKYGALWRDIVRIVTINISFMQINASLPSIIPNVWPESYMSFLADFDFVSMDILSVLGIPCVTPMDFRLSVAVAGLAPLCIAVLAVLMYLCRRAGARKATNKIVHDKAMRLEAAKYLFDVLDVQESQTIDALEFQHLLVFLGNHHSTKEQAATMLQTVLKHTSDNKYHRSNNTQELTRQQFLAAITSGEIEGLTHSGNKWVNVVEKERIFTSYLAGTMLLFLLIHAPVSQRVFYYFNHHDIQGRAYLRSDYSIEYNVEGGAWVEFLPWTILILIFFVFGFPLLIIAILLKNRHHLHSPHNRRRLGFIYKPFVRGAEFWELHEVFRKMMLMSIIIFVPEKTRTPVAILICVLAIASLNYTRPHKNSIVFWVAETSFILTAFKYLACIFIVTREDMTTYDTSKESLGWVLIALDVCMMLGSLVAVVAVAVLLKKAKKMMKGEDSQSSNNVAVVPATNMLSKWNLTPHDVRKAARHAKVEKTEDEAAKAHDAAVQEIQLHQSQAQRRLMKRLEKRKTLSNTQVKNLANAVNPVKVETNKEEGPKQAAELGFSAGGQPGTDETKIGEGPPKAAELGFSAGGQSS